VYAAARLFKCGRSACERPECESIRGDSQLDLELVLAEGEAAPGSLPSGEGVLGGIVEQVSWDLDDTPRMLSMLKGDASLLLFSCFRSIEM
jgi:hypothetical protein